MSNSNMESLLGQAWEEYTRQRDDVPPALNLLCEDLWHKIAQMEAPTPEEEDARLDICADLTERLASLGSSLGGSLAAEPHGSFLMGCFTSSSTLEVAVTGKLPAASGPNSLVDVELRGAGERLALLERVHSLIADCGVAAQGTVNINRAARVPSVSFEHASSGIPVRVCVAYPNFALRPQVVRGLALLEPRLRSLIQLVELWADARGLNNPAAGTFNSWALVNLVIFAAQTFQPQPLLPPLWRVCGGPEPAAAGAAMAGAAGAGGPTGGTGSASTGGAAGSSGGALMSIGSLLLEGGGGGGGSSLGFGIGGGGGGSSAGGATPMAVRPTQRLPGLTSSSEGLAPVLRDILARITGPPEALGLPVGCGQASGSDAAAVGVGLLSLFHWFLVLLDQLLAHWQLSWNRRWRVSTWWAQLVQQPFNRAFLVPLECPFDPADNAAKSLGCENQSKHQQVLRGVVAEVGASLRLLRAARSPEDLDRLIQGMFGLEVEHLYLEEEAGPDVEGEELGWAAERPQRAQAQGERSEDEVAAEAHRHEPEDPGAADRGGAGRSAAPPAAAGSGGSAGDVRSPATQVRLLRADEPDGKPAANPQRAGSPAAAVGTPFATSPAMPGEGAPRSGGGKASGKGKSKAVAGQRCRASPAAGAAVAAAATTTAGATQKGHGMAEEAGLGFDIEAVRVEKGVDDVVDDGAASAGGGDSGRRGRRRQAPAAADSPPLPTSSAAMVTAASPAVLRANARVQRPLSPLLRDVTNARQYGSQSGPEPKQPGPGPSAATATAAAGPSTSAASTSAATSAAESPGGGELLLPFEGLFGSFLEGARRLFDNMAQGMAELGEDLNELAATTAATIRAVINDDEDLPFLTSSSSAALRRQRRQRLQLLHRGGAPPGGAGGGAAAAGGGGGGSSVAASSPASTSTPASQHRSQALQPRTPASPAPGAATGRAVAGQQQQPRASPLGGGGGATPGRRAAAAAVAGTGASPGLRSPGLKVTAGPPALPGVVPCAVAAAGGGSAAKQQSQPQARVAKQRSKEVAAALTAAATPPATEADADAPLTEQHQQQQEPSKEATAGASVGPGSPTKVDGVSELAPDGPSAAAEAAAVDGTAAAAAAAATAPAPVAGIHGDGAAGITAAAAGGPPVMLLAVPVDASEHPLASSPLPGQAAAAAQSLPEAAVPPPPPAAADAPAPAVVASASTRPVVVAVGNPAAQAPEAPCVAGGDAASEAEPPREAAAAAASAAVPLAVGLLRLGSTAGSVAGDGGGGSGGAASTCGTCLTRASTPTADADASSASSPTVATSRSFAPTPTRKSGTNIQVPMLARAATEPALSATAAAAAASGGGGGAVRAGAGGAGAAPRNAPPPPPPLPPPPRPPLGVGGLRVKSATFRKGAARESLVSPTGTPGSAAATPNTTTTSAASTTATTTTAGHGQLLPHSSVAAAAAAFSTAPATTSVAAAAAAAAALLQDPAARTVLRLSSGRLQELAECIDRAGPCTTVDLQGGTFSGPLAAPAMKVTAPGLWLINGELALGPEQQLVVVAKAARMTDVTIRDLALPPAATAAAATPPPPPLPPGIAATGGAGAPRPALLVTKQSYVGGGELTLTRCQLLFGSGRGVGVQVKGKGCSANLEACQLRGSWVAAVQASDAALTLSGCTMELGSGQGLCCRDNAAVSATDCRLRAFGGACAAVLTGGSLELAGCTLSGGGAGLAAATAAAAAGGLGVLAEGKGSSLVARGSALVGFRGQAALVVTAGASVSLEDCRATDSGQGAVVGTRGGRLLAARSELSSNSSHGLAIGEGATADLRDCRLRGNGAAGLRVGGVGSMAVLRGCEVSRNAGSGVAVAAGGCANLDGCTASANGSGAGAGTDGTQQQQQQEESGPGGAGLHVEGGGARVTALRCAFSANAGSGVRVGQYGSVQLLGCGVHGNNSSDTLAGVAGADRDGEASGPCERWVVEVEVGAHGRATLSRGCSWGLRDGPGAEAGGAAGGPQGGLRAAELGCLEVLGD